MTGLFGKTILITGASSGIGRASATEFAKYGTNLFLVGRNERRLKETVAECQILHPDTNVAYKAVELTGENSAQDVVDGSRKTFDTMHILVNNAASLSSKYGPLLKNRHAEGFDYAYRLIVRTPWLLSTLFIDDIINNKGSIINVSSSASTIPSPNLAAYCTMKAAMDHMSTVMAVELGEYGVRVNTVNPGIVNTRILRGYDLKDNIARELSKKNAALTTPLESRFGGREVPALDVAKMIVFLASDDAASVTGAKIHVDGGSTKAHPTYSLTKKRQPQK